MLKYQQKSSGVTFYVLHVDKVPQTCDQKSGWTTCLTDFSILQRYYVLCVLMENSTRQNKTGYICQH